MTVSSKNHQAKEEGRSGGDGGKFKRKLLEVNTRAVSRGQNELLGKFKMAAGEGNYGRQKQ